MSSLIRVGVLDEQELVRCGLRAHLASQPGIEVSGTYDCVSGVLHSIRKGNIDLLLMGHVLEDSDRKKLIDALQKHHPELRMLAYLADPCPATAAWLFKLGVHGIVCRSEPLEACVQAIRLLVTGGRYLGACIAIAEMGEVVGKPLEADDPAMTLISHPSLSLREREVLRLCISGLTVTRIAEIFGRSLKTVSTQKRSAYRKLGLENDMDLFKTLSRYHA